MVVFQHWAKSLYNPYLTPIPMFLLKVPLILGNLNLQIPNFEEKGIRRLRLNRAASQARKASIRDGFAGPAARCSRLQRI